MATKRIMPMKFVQLNMQHSRIATNNLIRKITEGNIDFALIQEPYNINNNLAGIPKALKTFAHGGGRKRTAIIVNNNKLDAVLVSQLSDEDCIVLEVRHQNNTLYCASMYFDISIEIERNISRVESIIRQANGTPLIIAADTNARSKLWYDTISNKRGKILEEFLTMNSLYIANENTHSPTFETARRKSRIDLTICNNEMSRRITDWQCGEEESHSDHNIIEFSIQKETQINNQIYQRTRYIVKADQINKFKDNLSSIVDEKFKINNDKEDLANLDEELKRKIQCDTNATNIIEDLNRALISACNKTFDKTKGVKHVQQGRTVPWWTAELTIMRKRLNALRRRYQRTRNDVRLREERKGQYAEQKRLYEAKQNEEKFKSWQQLCNITEGSNPWNQVYKIASGKIKPATKLTTLRRNDGTYTENLPNTIKHMIDHFVPEDDEATETHHHKEIRKQIKQPPNTEDDKEFTQQEIEDILKGMDPKKAPGEDGITSAILIAVFNTLPKSTTTMYNTCLKNGYFPETWKRSTIIPIVKPGREWSDEVTKFRPISLINVAGKVLEKLLINRIMHHMVTKKLMNKHQYGFTPQRGTTDAAMAVKKFVENAERQKQVVVMTSLDVRGAFDAAWWPSILYNLKSMNCPKNLYRLTENYFSHRTAILKLNTHEKEKEVSKGCPQGSCSGPGFWNILYNTLLNLNFTKRTKVIAFADDLLVLTKGEYPTEAENYANQDLKLIEKWAKSNKIEFNDDKSKTLLITNRRRLRNTTVNIFVNNKKLAQVTQLKYLGLYFDSKFKFDKHIEYLEEKCIKLINILGRSARLQWGLGNKAMTTIYKGVIIPIVTYGAPVWEAALNKQHNVAKIRRIQRITNLKICKGFRTISYEASCILAGMMPLVKTIEETAQLYNDTKQLEEYDKPAELGTWLHPAEITGLTPTDKETKYEIEIYTDGSKTDKGVGSGIVIYRDGMILEKIKHKLGPRSSNNQAEQLAILKSLERIEELTPTGNQLVSIFTDSRITLDSISNTRNHNRLIESIRLQKRTLERKNWKIHFSWVKGHSGIAGNEIADQLAKEAAEQNAEATFAKVPKRTIKAEIQKSKINIWQREWQNTTKGQITKMFFPNVMERLRMNIPFTPNFTTFVTGHGKLNSYYYRFRIKDNPTCPCNKGDQTIEHLLLNCKLIDKQRNLLRSQIIKKGGTWPPKKHHLVEKYLKEL